VYVEGFAEVNGTSQYYEMTGEGEVLVLLHSGFTDLRQWDDQFNFFGKYFKVIRYDIRGLGKSDRPSKPFSHVEDLKGLFGAPG
jgi:pimeloyl-ACP methyl ester carboxylesterase